MTEIETISINSDFKKRFGKYLEDHPKKKKSRTYVEVVDEFLQKQGY